MLTNALIAEAQKDHKALWRKVDTLLPQLRRMDTHVGDTPMAHLVPWASPRGNQWLLHFTPTAAGPVLRTLIHGCDAKGRTHAVIVATTGTSFVIDANVLERYRAHTDASAEPLEVLQSFFYGNHAPGFEPVSRAGAAQRVVHVALDHGLAQGEWCMETDTVHLRTFVDYARLLPERTERGDLAHHWNSLSINQQIARLTELKLTHVGTLYVAA